MDVVRRRHGRQAQAWRSPAGVGIPLPGHVAGHAQAHSRVIGERQWGVTRVEVEDDVGVSCP